MALTGASRLAPVPLRLAVGAACAYYGYHTLFASQPFNQFIQQVSDLGLPKPDVLAYVGAWGALAGGIMMIVGFATRVAALLNAAALGVILWEVKFGGDPTDLLHKIQHSFAGPDGYMTPLILLLSCLSLVLTGAGALSLDSLLAFKKPPPPKPLPAR